MTALNTRIIAAFPGTGKSYFTQNSTLKCSDSDSSEFSWVKDQEGSNTKERNPNFPDNYLDHIISNLGQVDVIFVSSHEVVRNELVAEQLPFTLVYPSVEDKQAYIDRFRHRGSPEGFINLLSANWETWLKDCSDQVGCEKVELPQGGFISDLF